MNPKHSETAELTDEREQQSREALRSAIRNLRRTRRPTIELDFAIGAAVHMDGLTDMRGVVTAISIGTNGVTYEVSWWNERQHCAAWFTPARLASAEGDNC